MLQKDNIIANYPINSNIQSNTYEFDKDKYNQIYDKQKMVLLAYLVLDLIVKILGACIELDILNIIRKNLLNGLSIADIIRITTDLVAILMLIYADELALDLINNTKQLLKIIKEKDIETLKILSKTIK